MFKSNNRSIASTRIFQEGYFSEKVGYGETFTDNVVKNIKTRGIEVKCEIDNQEYTASS